MTSFNNQPSIRIALNPKATPYKKLIDYTAHYFVKQIVWVRVITHLMSKNLKEKKTPFSPTSRKIKIYRITK